MQRAPAGIKCKSLCGNKIQRAKSKGMSPQIILFALARHPNRDA